MGDRDVTVPLRNSRPKSSESPPSIDESPTYYGAIPARVTPEALPQPPPLPSPTRTPTKNCQTKGIADPTDVVSTPTTMVVVVPRRRRRRDYSADENGPTEEEAPTEEMIAAEEDYRRKTAAIIGRKMPLVRLRAAGLVVGVMVGGEGAARGKPFRRGVG